MRVRRIEYIEHFCWYSKKSNHHRRVSSHLYAQTRALARCTRPSSSMACSTARPRPRPPPLSRGGAFGRRFRLRTKRHLPPRFVSTTKTIRTTMSFLTPNAWQREDDNDDDENERNDDSRAKIGAERLLWTLRGRVERDE